MPKQVDELTKLGIRISTLTTQVETAFDRYKQLECLVKDTVQAQNSIIEDLQRKTDILAKAVQKLAKSQGRWPKQQETELCQTNNK